MAISTTCPGCKALFRLADDLAGKQVKCQKCQKLFVVPSANGSMTVAGISVPDENPASGSMFDDASTSASSPHSTPLPPTSLPPMPAAPAPLQETSDVEDRTKKSESSSPGSKSDADVPDVSQNRAGQKATKSNTALIAVLSVLIGGGVLSCCACAGIVGIIALRSNDNNQAEAFPAWGGINVVLGVDGAFQSDTVLDNNDPVKQFDPKWGPKVHKLYVVRLEAKRSYQIDMITNDPRFDAYLHVADDQNNILAFDDDGGGFPNAQIPRFTPPRTGFYRIYATSLEGHDQGRFTLVIRRL